ncbi:cysteine hydrolase family protein [Streptomyces clavuligerus]|uniref:cysteine hydrolase family protein n=1 Tax=Streptomyces clavuligerus TaxID=1901 RepID=UPI0018D0501B|nr:isochorismatase family protein [Streptomyces clavuligerus]
MGLDRAVLVIVDAQRGFINPHTRPVVLALVELARRWTGAGRPLVLTRFRNPPASPYERITGWTRMRTPAEQRIVDELAPWTRSAHIVDKTGSSAITPEFACLARLHGWRDLILAGMDTDACVYDTATTAYHHGGFVPWIVTDACASGGGPDHHEAALLLARRNLGPRQLLTTGRLGELLTHPGPGPGACA